MSRTCLHDPNGIVVSCQVFMNIIIDESKDKLADMAANVVQAQINDKPDSVLGLATGSTPLSLYERLIKRYRATDIDFSKITSFNLDEYVGLPKDHPCGYYSYMKKHLFDHINIRKDQYHLPDGMNENPQDECLQYEEKIRGSGGIDLQILGIGHNGHIGFNEPGTPFHSMTHVITLDERTKKANARFFETIDCVPERAITMGIKTIMRARKILLIATGADKKYIVYKALYGPITEDVPASVLQLHPDVTVFLDSQAVLEKSHK